MANIQKKTIYKCVHSAKMTLFNSMIFSFETIINNDVYYELFSMYSNKIILTTITDLQEMYKPFTLT